MKLSKKVLKELKEQLYDDSCEDCEVGESEINTMEDLIGKKYFIRTVTYHLVGKIEKIVGDFFVLSGASWVADSGRFTQAIEDGTLNEVEPVGEAMVNSKSIVDMFPWTHALPTSQK